MTFARQMPPYEAAPLLQDWASSASPDSVQSVQQGLLQVLIKYISSATRPTPETPIVTDSSTPFAAKGWHRSNAIDTIWPECSSCAGNQGILSEQVTRAKTMSESKRSVAAPTSSSVCTSNTRLCRSTKG